MCFCPLCLGLNYAGECSNGGGRSSSGLCFSLYSTPSNKVGSGHSIFSIQMK